MKGGANIISSIQNIRQAKEHFESFKREHPNTKGATLFGGYSKRLDWIFNDLVSHPLLTDEVRKGVRQEWESDVFSVPAINEKVALLNPEQREAVEAIIDSMLSGEEIVIKDIKDVNY